MGKRVVYGGLHYPFRTRVVLYELVVVITDYEMIDAWNSFAAYIMINIYTW